MDKDNTVPAVFKYLHSLFLTQVVQYYIHFLTMLYMF